MSGDKKEPGNFFSGPTRRAEQPSAEPAKSDPLRNQTRRIDTSGQEPSRPGSSPTVTSGLTPPTQLWRPGQQAPAAGSEAPVSASQSTNDLVVGWLVILNGPGQGTSLPLGYGWNSVGRGANQRVRLDFGDGEISRENHCAVAYDGKNRKFFIQHGGGRNLTYLGDSPVLAPQELTADATISVGSTNLRFVPFCGDKFDWVDLNSSGTTQE